MKSYRLNNEATKGFTGALVKEFVVLVTLLKELELPNFMQSNSNWVLLVERGTHIPPGKMRTASVECK